MTDSFKISKGLGNLAEETLRFYRQIGVEEVAVPARLNTRVNLRPLVPPVQCRSGGFYWLNSARFPRTHRRGGRQPAFHPSDFDRPLC